MKKVSVILCTNKIDKLEFGIRSFLRQTYENKELIVVLNNNRFNIEKIREEYPKIKVIQIDEKENLCYCLNRGCEIAQGDLIAKMDDDDIYSNKYLENSVKWHIDNNADISGLRVFPIYIESLNHFGYTYDYEVIPIIENNIATIKTFDMKENTFIGLDLRKHFSKKTSFGLIGGTMIFNREVWENN